MHGTLKADTWLLCKGNARFVCHLPHRAPSKTLAMDRKETSERKQLFTDFVIFAVAKMWDVNEGGSKIVCSLQKILQKICYCYYHYQGKTLKKRKHSSQVNYNDWLYLYNSVRYEILWVWVAEDGARERVNERARWEFVGVKCHNIHCWNANETDPLSQTI